MLSKVLGLMNGNYPLPPVEQVGTQGTRRVEGTGKNPFAGGGTEGLNAFPQESMAYLNTATSGSVYKNGMGHSNFGLMKPYLA